MTRDQTMRRVYGDGLVAQFAARGLGTKVNAVRSHEFVEGAFAADGTKAILDAARRQGAAAVLSNAVVGHEHIAHVLIDGPIGRWYGAYDGWYQHYWPYLYRRADVQVTQRYLAGTTLIDVATGKIRWTARSLAHRR